MRELDPSTLRALSEPVLEIVGEAMRLVRSHMPAEGQPWEVTYKSGPNDPLTEADLAVDRLLREQLAPLVDDAAMLTEEQEDDRSRLGCSRVWIIDPIDGTRTLVAGRQGDGLGVEDLSRHRFGHLSLVGRHIREFGFDHGRHAGEHDSTHMIDLCHRCVDLFRQPVQLDVELPRGVDGEQCARRGVIEEVASRSSAVNVQAGLVTSYAHHARITGLGDLDSEVRDTPGSRCDGLICVCHEVKGDVGGRGRCDDEAGEQED